MIQNLKFESIPGGGGVGGGGHRVNYLALM